MLVDRTRCFARGVSCFRNNSHIQINYFICVDVRKGVHVRRIAGSFSSAAHSRPTRNTPVNGATGLSDTKNMAARQSHDPRFDYFRGLPSSASTAFSGLSTLTMSVSSVLRALLPLLPSLLPSPSMIDPFVANYDKSKRANDAVHAASPTSSPSSESSSGDTPTNSSNVPETSRVLTARIGTIVLRYICP